MNYPKATKAFYMRLNDDGPTVAPSLTLPRERGEGGVGDPLAPGIGEIIGGSQREERLEVLDRNMAERGIDKEHYAWYRDLRRYGTVPHAGFGLGFERTLAYVTGLAHVRDAIPFPRTPGNHGIDEYYAPDPHFQPTNLIGASISREGADPLRRKPSLKS